MDVALKYQSYSGSKGFFYYNLHISKIEFKSLNIENDTINISCINETIKADVKLTGIAKEYVEGLSNSNERKKSLKDKDYSIIHSGIKSFSLNLSISIPREKILLHDFEIQSLRISNDTSTQQDFTYKIEFEIRQAEKENLISQFIKDIENDLKNKETDMVIQQKKKNNQTTPKKERIIALKKQFEELEKLQQHKQIKYKDNLTAMNIYLTHPNAYRRCENCANFTNYNRCSSHMVEVSMNHTCKRFYNYKIVFGGAFSPK